MANERNFGNVNELCAIGFSAARLHNPTLAELARRALAARSQAKEEGDLRPASPSWAAGSSADRARGRPPRRAVAILKAATEAELKLPPPLACRSPSNLLGQLGECCSSSGGPARRWRRSAVRRATPTMHCRCWGWRRPLRRSGSRTRRVGTIAPCWPTTRADADLPEIAEARGNRHGCGEQGRAGRRGGDGHRDRRGSGSGCRDVPEPWPHASRRHRDTAAERPGGVAHALELNRRQDVLPPLILLIPDP